MFFNVLFPFIKKFRKVSGTGNLLPFSARKQICKNIKKDREQTNNFEVLGIYSKIFLNFTLKIFI